MEERQMSAVEQAAPQNAIGQTVDDVIARGDLSKLSPEDRVVHYHNVCKSLGLNPFTQPFQYITLNGKLQLYARRDAADQLRKLHGINIEVVDRSVHNDLLTVHVRATDKSGRRDEDFGVVSIGGLKGEAAANAFLKCVTKAKRRVTLSISGLGFSDETEIDDIPGAEPQSFATPTLPPRPEAPSVPSSDDYVAGWEVMIENAISADDLTMKWNAERPLRGQIEWRDDRTPARLKEAVTRRIEKLRPKDKRPDLTTQRLEAQDT
jgi:hypothetical protein